MRPDPEALAELGRIVRINQDSALYEDSAVERASEELFDGRAPRPGDGRGRAWRARLTVLVPVAVAAAVIALWFALSRPAALTATDGEGLAVAQGEWLNAKPAEDRALRFSDGSTVLLRGPSRARVESLSQRGADVTVERGSVAVSVVHREATAFSFHAGPYRVLVTGTRFDLSWEPVTERFAIEMHDGSVRLDGPGLEGGRSVVAGQRVVVVPDAEQPVAALSSAAALTAPLSGPSGASLPEPLAASSATAGPSPGEPRWRALARDGRYGEAFRDARPGFEAALSSLGAQDLLLLADTAVYAGEPGHGRVAYERIRARFGRSPQAAIAAFQLGRIESPGAATRWFRTYLAEAPSGPLAREALGRVLEAEARAGDRAAARRTAASYLDRFPRGPHADLARRVVAE
jgi:ferric-dicitrate binding protein FerR (iron transport regulator)